MIFFLTLVKGIKLSCDSVPNEEKGLTASKKVTLNSMEGRGNTIGILEKSKVNIQPYRQSEDTTFKCNCFSFSHFVFKIKH